jgi:hypothetical protein
VTVSLHGVTLPEALKAVLGPLGDTYRRDGAVYQIEAAPNGMTGNAIAPAVMPVNVTTVKRAAAQLHAVFSASLDS